MCERVNSSERRLFVEQIATVVALGCGRKVDAMWHVPHCYCTLVLFLRYSLNQTCIIISIDYTDENE